jgi:hypothetical protein
MRIATYNVNGVNGRLANLLGWLHEAVPDIVCLQELKAPDDKFPAAAEAKHVTRERILPKHCLRLRRQAVEPLAHVGGARRQPYPGVRRQTAHRNSSIAKNHCCQRGH